MQKDPDAGSRRHLRVPYAGGTAAVRCSKSGPTISGSLIDISVSGCLVSMPEPLEVTSDQMIEVRLDLTHLAVRVMGFVRHMNRANNAVGIEFYKLSEKDRADLEEFVSFFAPL